MLFTIQVISDSLQKAKKHLRLYSKWNEDVFIPGTASF